MKNIVVVISTTILGVLVLMIVMTINGRTNRSMEIQSNLSSVVEETMDNMALNPKYNIQNTNEFIADLVETLSMTIDAQSDVTVDVLQCDKERGILSVKVTLSYVHPNGNLGTVECERNVIFNKLQEEELKQCRVTFYIGSDIYKEYIVTEGAILTAPVSPSITDGVFYGWIDGTGVTVDFSQPVLQDVVYYANVG